MKKISEIIAEYESAGSPFGAFGHRLCLGLEEGIGEGTKPGEILAALSEKDQAAIHLRATNDEQWERLADKVDAMTILQFNRLVASAVAALGNHCAESC